MSTQTTPAPRKRRAEHPLTTIPATVVASLWLTPRMIRLTIHSDRMGMFVRSNDPDQFLTVIFPRPGQQLIQLKPDFDWHYFYALPAEVRPQARNYTIRSFDLEANTVEVDVLVHGGPGLGENWAATVQPGAGVYLWGPRIAYNPFPNVDFHLMFCDECGVPAAAAIFESLPELARGHLVAEVKNEGSIPPMPVRKGIQIDWMFAGDLEPGEGSLLLEAVQSLSPPAGDLVYAWGGGEMKSMQKIRRHLRKTWGLKTSSISALGYWRAGQSAGD